MRSLPRSALAKRKKFVLAHTARPGRETSVSLPELHTFATRIFIIDDDDDDIRATNEPTPSTSPPLPSKLDIKSANSHIAIMSSTTQSVQCFGKKRTATAVAHCKSGKGLIKVNGKPLSLVEPQILRFKVYEPVLILGLDKFGMRHIFSCLCFCVLVFLDKRGSDGRKSEREEEGLGDGIAGESRMRGLNGMVEKTWGYHQQDDRGKEDG